MTTHISEELPRLLTGEASRSEVVPAAAHLRDCQDCQHELISALVAHASLASARRFAPDLVTASPVIPPAEVNRTLPDLSGVFAEVRAEAEAQEPAQPRTRAWRPVLAAAVAAGVLVGGAAGAGVVQALTHHTPTGRPVALAPFDKGATPAHATLINGDEMRIDAASLPRLDSRHRYEVWLTNSARTQMQPVGWISAGNHADLTVPSDLMASYSDIEVSVQQVDAATYSYSGTSVLRGSYRS